MTPSFTPGVPIHFLGRRYIDLRNGELHHLSCGTLDGDVEAFLTNFKSRLWFTYREAFPPLPVPLNEGAMCPHMESLPSSSISSASSPSAATFKSTAAARRHLRTSRCQQGCDPPVIDKIPLSLRTSDCGWGCMLRSAQMLLAQALAIHFIGRDWNFPLDKWISQQDPNARMHRQIIKWFADTPESPLSIHRIVEASGSPPGTMFGPAAICRALVIAMANSDAYQLAGVEVYLARDRVICSEEVMDLFEESPATSHCSKSASYGDGVCCLAEHTGKYRPHSNGPASLDVVDSGIQSSSELDFLFLHM